MSRQIIHIPQPCAQPWVDMVPTATGRHCTSCAKTVVDFTQHTDAEILAYFRQGHAGTCGRFRAAQLGRPLAAATSPVRPWQHWLAALLLAALATPGCTPDARQPAAPTVPLATVRPPLAALNVADSASSTAPVACSPALLGYTVTTKAPRLPVLQKIQSVPSVATPDYPVVGEPALEQLPDELVVGKPALPLVADSARTKAPSTN